MTRSINIIQQPDCYRTYNKKTHIERADLKDRLGSVRQNVSDGGTLLDAINYDSFGQILSETDASAGDRFKFTAREWDGLFDEYYYRRRYYGADTGRFKSIDPMGFAAGDSDLYRYVGNGPTNFTDPTGMDRFIYSFIDSWSISVTDSLGNTHTPMTAQELFNTLNMIRNNGRTVEWLIIAGHGGGDRIQLGPRGRNQWLSCTGTDGRPGPVNLILDDENPDRNINITTLLSQICNQNTTISFRGCQTSDLAENVFDRLGVSTRGIWGYGSRLPFTNSSLGRYYSFEAR